MENNALAYNTTYISFSGKNTGLPIMGLSEYGVLHIFCYQHMGYTLYIILGHTRLMGMSLKPTLW